MITWATPAPLAYSLPLSATQLNASADAGTFFTRLLPALCYRQVHMLLGCLYTDRHSRLHHRDGHCHIERAHLFVRGHHHDGCWQGNQGNSGDGGQAIAAEMIFPESIAVDSAGNIYIPDSTNAVVREVSASTGIITTIPGTGTTGYSGDGGQATHAQLNTPMAVAVDASGNVYIADSNNNRIRKITVSTGIISTVAGTGTAGDSGDNGLATSAELSFPAGVAIDGSGNLYIADSQNSVVQRWRRRPRSSRVFREMVSRVIPATVGQRQARSSGDPARLRSTRRGISTSQMPIIR